MQRIMPSVIATCMFLGMVCAIPTYADDWPEWRGKDRSAVWNESNILSSFPDDGLKVRWKKTIGSGYSGPIVVDGKVITMDFLPKPESKAVEVIERVVCLDEATGETLWMDELETHYREVMKSYRTGPRATPTVDGDRVYTLGSVGHLRCVDITTGKLLWSKDSREEYELTPPIWGTSTAPIVADDLVIYATGGSGPQLRAYNKMTGEEVWQACPANYELGYSQFILADHAGVRQLIYWDPQYLRGLNPATGEVYWEVPMAVKSAMSVATPVKSESKILVSSFYSGSMLVELSDDAPEAKKLWHIQGSGERPDQTEGLHCVITTPVIEDNFFYGTCSYGEMRGLELATSKRVWDDTTLTRQGRWGSCFFVKNQDRYFVFSDTGELLILRLTPEGPELIDRTQLIDPDTESGWGPRRWANSIVCWCHPAFANGHVIVRNDHEIISASLSTDDY